MLYQHISCLINLSLVFVFCTMPRSARLSHTLKADHKECNIQESGSQHPIRVTVPATTLYSVYQQLRSLDPWYCKRGAAQRVASWCCCSLLQAPAAARVGVQAAVWRMHALPVGFLRSAGATSM